MHKATLHTNHDCGHDHTHERVRHTHGHPGHEHDNSGRTDRQDPGQQAHGHSRPALAASGRTLVLRPFTGMAGDIMAAGLAGLLHADQEVLDGFIVAIGMPELAPGCFTVQPHMVNEVSGLIGRINLPHEHVHRTFADIRAIIQASALEDGAKVLAGEAFRLIAEAEAAVHGSDVDAVRFHEVGALDSILDICLGAALFNRLAPSRFVCGPLPLCDGIVRCAHGCLPAPAPAVLRLLHGVPVHGIPGSGETVTPTGLALLKAFGAEFGPWPSFTLECACLAYGNRIFPDTPNGAIFAFGSAPFAPQAT